MLFRKNFLRPVLVAAAVMSLCAVGVARADAEQGKTEASVLKEIFLTDIDNVKIGYATDNEAKTGVTVLVFPNGVNAGVDISGGGPASRETPVLSPTGAPTPLNAVVLGGGSAFGLDAAGGVMQYLEEQGIGYQTGFAIVPIVVQSDIYDLSYGRSDVRPDKAMGYAAAKDALTNNKVQEGNVGSGAGATVGKLKGMKRAQKAGLGIYAAQVGALKVAAVVTVNALGDIYEPEHGQKIAGLLTEDRKNFVNLKEELYKTALPDGAARSNTTIGAVVTNGKFTKGELAKIAAMATNAYARCIHPAGTLADGDTVYAVGTGEIDVDLNLTGTLAAEVMGKAIVRAIETGRISDEEYLSNIKD